MHSSDTYEDAINEALLFFSKDKILGLLNSIKFNNIVIKTKGYLTDAERIVLRYTELKLSYIYSLYSLKRNILLKIDFISRETLVKLERLYNNAVKLSDAQFSFLKEKKEISFLLDKEYDILKKEEEKICKTKHAFYSENVYNQVLAYTILIKLSNKNSFNTFDFEFLSKALKILEIEIDGWESLIIESIIHFYNY